MKPDVSPAVRHFSVKKFILPLAVMLTAFVLIQFISGMGAVADVRKSYNLTSQSSDIETVLANRIYNDRLELFDKQINRIRSTLMNLSGLSMAVLCFGFILANMNRKMENGIDTYKKEFISTMSHELRTPLTSLSAYSQLLKNKLADRYASDEYLYAEKISNQVERMRGYIIELIESVRINSNVPFLKKHVIDLNPVVQEVVSDIRMRTRRSDIYAELDPKQKVYADSNGVRMILTQLVDNAVRFSRMQGGPISIRSVNTGKHTVVSVKDNGIGIPKKYQEKIFRKYFQVRENITRDDPNLGLGLYISDQIVRKQGGKMWVDSEEGRGSIFYFTLKPAG